MNKYEEERKLLSIKLRKSNEDIEFIWNNILNLDVNELQNIWNSKERQIFVEKIYDIDKQIKFIFRYSDDLINKLNQDLR